ncbi:MAG: hypothetical protein MZV65_45230 [Chromatiales bacterium]|nr:hypothetical protein [Chromatiales bacterium]
MKAEPADRKDPEYRGRTSFSLLDLLIPIISDHRLWETQRDFIQVQRKTAGYRPLNERIYDFGEVEQTLNEQDRKDQASRCMDCGVPFCQWGCPVMNNMPEWQDAIYRGDWKNAIDLLHVTNNFPEFTGRICPGSL